MDGVDVNGNLEAHIKAEFYYAKMLLWPLFMDVDL